MLLMLAVLRPYTSFQDTGPLHQVRSHEILDPYGFQGTPWVRAAQAAGASASSFQDSLVWETLPPGFL